MSRRTPTTDDAFAHAGLVALILASLRQDAPELIPAELAAPDGVRRAHAPLHLKRDLLVLAWQTRGPRFVFDMGRCIEGFETHPILEAMLRSRDGDVLLEKWARYERYAHGRHRTRRLRAAAGDYELEHFARAGAPPTPAEDIFILGFLAALLERLALPDIGVGFSRRDRRLIEGGVRLEVGEEAFQGDTSRWRLTFAPGLHAISAAPAPADPGDAAGCVRALLREDPARSWSVAQAARATGQSARSLQRRLAASGTAFAQLVREARVAEACRLLETTSHSLTEVGYAAGFSDAAHFSRDFRASTGATPTEFRVVVS